MAAVDYFLKIEGIEGESPDDKHKNEFQLDSWSWGQSNVGTSAAGGGGGAGKVAMNDFQFIKRVDKGSHKLLLACANGEHFKKATLTCRKAGKEQQEYLKITFSDVLVSSFHTSGSELIPMDQVSLNFTKIEYEYKEQKADGSLGPANKAGYDLKLMKAV